MCSILYQPISTRLLKCRYCLNTTGKNRVSVIGTVGNATNRNVTAHVDNYYYFDNNKCDKLSGENNVGAGRQYRGEYVHVIATLLSS